MKKLLLAAMVLTLICPPASADEDLARVDRLIKTSVNSILKTLKNSSIDKEVKRDEVMKIIDPLFDFELMAKLVLGRKHWPRFDKKQRKEFTRLFVEQLRGSYFDKVDLLSDEKVEFGEPLRKDKKFHMKSYILSKDKRYEMVYKLYSRKGMLKVYDVEIEGISIVKSYSSQYDQFLQDKSIKELLAKMKSRSIKLPKELEHKEAKGKKDGPEAPTAGEKKQGKE